MKVIKIGYDYYKYPEGMDDVASFCQSLNDGKLFRPMTLYLRDNCVFPYLVEEDTKEIHINFSCVGAFYEEEATVLSREEYDHRLKLLMKEICVNCADYVENPLGDNMSGHRDKMCLDGNCDHFVPKEKDTIVS